jgi:hypothetical protein
MVEIGINRWQCFLRIYIQAVSGKIYQDTEIIVKQAQKGDCKCVIQEGLV